MAYGKSNSRRKFNSNTSETPYIKCDLEKNEFRFYHNKFGKQDNENVKYQRDNSSAVPFEIVATKENNEFLGFVVSDFFNKNSNGYKGLKAEEDFKELLTKKNLPCLHVGQGVNFSERTSPVRYCNDSFKIKRPDFLVSLPELGNVLIDVKCRRKKDFFDGQRLFYINYNDIDDLAKLRTYLTMPVWLAFKDFDDSGNVFWICPIKIIADIKEKLFKEYPNSKNEQRKTRHLRIPEEILTDFTQNNLLNGFSDFDMTTHVRNMILLEKNSEHNRSYYTEDELEK